MPILWGLGDSGSESAHRSRVARPVQSVEHAIDACGAEQLRYLHVLWHGLDDLAARPILSPNKSGETLREGAR